jgi:hypothetical protein
MAAADQTLPCMPAVARIASRPGALSSQCALLQSRAMRADLNRQRDTDPRKRVPFEKFAKKPVRFGEIRCCPNNQFRFTDYLLFSRKQIGNPAAS